MSKDNKTARLELEHIYGKGCMFKRAGIDDRLKHSGLKIKGYKVFISEKHYTSKKIRQLEKIMTYHHLEHKADGGKATVDNGAVINELAHRYMHSLPREQEEIINDMLRDFKHSLDIRVGIMSIDDKGVNMQQPVVISLDDFQYDDCLTIPLEDNTKEDIIKRQKYNRAKAKREFQKRVDEELYKYEKGDDSDERE